MEDLTWQTMPPGILQKVFSLLPDRELVGCGVMCCHWRQWTLDEWRTRTVTVMEGQSVPPPAQKLLFKGGEEFGWPSPVINDLPDHVTEITTGRECPVTFEKLRHLPSSLETLDVRAADLVIWLGLAQLGTRLNKAEQLDAVSIRCICGQLFAGSDAANFVTQMPNRVTLLKVHAWIETRHVKHLPAALCSAQLLTLDGNACEEGLGKLLQDTSDWEITLSARLPEAPGQDGLSDVGVARINVLGRRRSLP